MTPQRRGTARNGVPSSSAPASGANATPTTTNHRTPALDPETNTRKTPTTYEKLRKLLQSLCDAPQIRESRSPAQVKSFHDAAIQIRDFIEPFLNETDAAPKYFRQFENKVLKALSGGNTTPAATSGRSWASMAAGVSPAPGTSHPRLANQAPNTVIIRPTTERAVALQGMSTAEVLQEIKKTLPTAAAVRHLVSGDIRIVLPPGVEKSSIMKKREFYGEKMGARILQTDYAVEVLGVPIQDMSIARGKDADNSALLRTIATATGRLVPDLQLTRIEWLHRENYLLGPPQEGCTT